MLLAIAAMARTGNQDADAITGDRRAVRAGTVLAGSAGECSAN